MSNAIVVKGLKKSYGKNVALRGVTFNVKKRSITGFLGRNGAGKTTTIRIIMGLLHKDSGEIVVNGQRLDGNMSEVKAKIGYMSEDFSLYEYMTGRQVLNFNRKFFGKINEEKVKRYASIFKISLNKRLKAFSKGMKQAISFIVATSTDPEILILDEPVSGLDPVMRTNMLKLISQECFENGSTVFYSSHILEDVEKISDAVCIIDNGKILLSSGLDELKEKRKKIIVVFEDDIDKSTLSEIKGVRDISESGHGYVLDVFGDVKEITDVLKKMNASSIDVIDMNLNDIFLNIVKGEEK